LIAQGYNETHGDRGGFPEWLLDQLLKKSSLNECARGKEMRLRTGNGNKDINTARNSATSVG